MMKQPQLDYYDMGSGVVAFSSTRHGGFSTENHAAFNINRYCGDSEENIRKNRDLLCQTLGISDDCLIMPAISRYERKWHIDLPVCNRQQLITAGLSPQNIKVSPVCTYKQAADYFSARRLGIDSGRIFTGILLK